MSKITFNLIFGTLMRSGLMLLAGWLVKKGILPGGMVEDWVTAVLLVFVTLLWSIWEKLQAKWNLSAALAAPAGSTLQEAKDLAKVGN